MQYDQCLLIRPYCIFDYQMLGDQIAATKLLRPIVVDPILAPDRYKQQCLICYKILSENKKSSVKMHYLSKHATSI